MRLTINLDDDLYAMARSHAVANELSMSKAVGDLLRKHIGSSESKRKSPPKDESDFHIDPVTQLPVVQARGPLTEEEIRRSLDDEDLRHLEAGKWAPKSDDA